MVCGGCFCVCGEGGGDKGDRLLLRNRPLDHLWKQNKSLIPFSLSLVDCVQHH